MATKNKIATLMATGEVLSLVFLLDGILALWSSSNAVEFWNVATMDKFATLAGHTGTVRSVAFSPDGTILASGAADGTVKLWDVSVALRPLPVGLVKISGDNQQGTPGAALANPFVVEVKDQNGNVLEGVAVTFAVTAGGGVISSTTDTTDANGRAQTTLTLGSDAGTNTVSVTVAGIEQPVAFTSEVLGPQTLVKVSGDKQEGMPGASLANPLVIEVKDQNGNVLEGIAVTFTVIEGDGKLSIKTAMTDSIGRAQTMLTLGNSLETTIVAVTVAGIEQPVTFTIKAVATPDFNGDGAVNIADFLLFVGQFGFSQGDEGYEARFDLDGDGVIGIGDFLIFVDNFGNAGS